MLISNAGHQGRRKRHCPHAEVGVIAFTSAQISQYERQLLLRALLLNSAAPAGPVATSQIRQTDVSCSWTERSQTDGLNRTS